MDGKTVKGTTRSGYAFEVSEDIANDMELLEALCDLDAGDARAMVPVCQKVFGAQKLAFYDHVRNAAGRVPLERVTEEIADVFDAIRDGKKF